MANYFKGIVLILVQIANECTIAYQMKCKAHQVWGLEIVTDEELIGYFGPQG